MFFCLNRLILLSNLYLIIYSCSIFSQKLEQITETKLVQIRFCQQIPLSFLSVFSSCSRFVMEYHKSPAAPFLMTATWQRSDQTNSEWCSQIPQCLFFAGLLWIRRSEEFCQNLELIQDAAAREATRMFRHCFFGCLLNPEHSFKSFFWPARSSEAKSLHIWRSWWHQIIPADHSSLRVLVYCVFQALQREDGVEPWGISPSCGTHSCPGPGGWLLLWGEDKNLPQSVILWLLIMLAKLMLTDRTGAANL